MKVRYLDLSKSNSKDLKKKMKLFKKFLLDGNLMMGNFVEKLETKVSKYIGVKYCVAVSSGTNALYLSIKSLGLKKGDEIIVPAISWYSTFTAIAFTGAKLVPADIDDDLILNFNKLEKLINKKTKAIVIVHFNGYFKNIDTLKKFCKKKKIYLVEDAAQAFGSKNNNRFAGSVGDIAAFSANPMKVFSGFGELGLITTSNKSFYDKIKMYRYAGLIRENDFDCFVPELNHKADEIQAMLIIDKLSNIKKIIKKRIEIANYYNSKITDKIKKPVFVNNFEHNYYNYTLNVGSKRDQFLKYLNTKNIETKIQHSKTVLDHKGLKNFSIKKKINNAKKLKKQIISIPVHENLKKNEIQYIVKSINSFF
jgi:dTDP-4-amino-4,6-dideoxygalactose transaminase